MVEDSIFTKIINGELPSHKVYEDDFTFALIPLHPIALGHVLVFPKKQVVQFFQLEDVDYIALMETVKKVANRMYEVIEPFRVGVKIEGLDVPHTHVHVIAFDNHEQFNETENTNVPVDQNKLKELAQKLAF